MSLAERRPAETGDNRFRAPVLTVTEAPEPFYPAVLPPEVEKVETATEPPRKMSVVPMAPPDPLLSRTRLSRLEAEAHPLSNHPVHRFMRKPILFGMSRVGDLAQWAIELSPFRFVWGPGDVLSLYMGLTRHNPLTGERVDRHEARLHLLAAAIPFVPSKAIVKPVSMLRRMAEEGHHAIRTGDFRHVRQEMTLKNAAKLVFAFL